MTLKTEPVIGKSDSQVGHAASLDNGDDVMSIESDASQVGYAASSDNDDDLMSIESDVSRVGHAASSDSDDDSMAIESDDSLDQEKYASIIRKVENKLDWLAQTRHTEKNKRVSAAFFRGANDSRTQRSFTIVDKSDGAGIPAADDNQSNIKANIEKPARKMAKLSLHHQEGNVKGRHFLEEYELYSDSDSDSDASPDNASSDRAVEYFQDARWMFFLKEEKCNDLDVENSDNVTVLSVTGSLASSK